MRGFAAVTKKLWNEYTALRFAESLDRESLSPCRRLVIPPFRRSRKTTHRALIQNGILLNRRLTRSPRALAYILGRCLGEALDRAIGNAAAQ